MTGPQGGSWYPMGGAIKNVVERPCPTPRSRSCRALASPTSRRSRPARPTSRSPTRSRPWTRSTASRRSTRRSTNVCNLATLYPQYFQIVTTADSGIESLDQLKGHGLTTQPTGNTGEAITAHLVEATGLSYDDLRGVDFVSYNDSVAAAEGRQLRGLHARHHGAGLGDHGPRLGARHQAARGRR